MRALRLPHQGVRQPPTGKTTGSLIQLCSKRQLFPGDLSSFHRRDRSEFPRACRRRPRHRSCASRWPSRLPLELHLRKRDNLHAITEELRNRSAESTGVISGMGASHCAMACLAWIASELASATSLPKETIIQQKPALRSEEHTSELQSPDHTLS